MYYSIKSRGMLYSLTVILCIVLYGLSAAPALGQDTGQSTHNSVNYAGNIMGSNDPRIPGYISAHINPPVPRMITGEVDSFELQISLDTARMKEIGEFSWNMESSSPVIAWLYITQRSGITFISDNDTGRTGNQVMVKFKRIPDDASHTLTATIAYTVDPKVRTGQYSAILDIFAELISADGRRFQDAGIIRLPMEVDTHLTKKFLMLAVVGLAIFLFVVEWFRVDVVAIIMMILLPELGLLNSGDAFRGLSSNAVIAIIGVMIISFGLNRTGLVNLAIQPILKYVKTGASRLVIVFSAMIAAISSVMQNTGAAVLFLPAIRRIATRELKIPISRVLMPIGMAAILGGTLTMIGTSPLILLNDILPAGMDKFGFLELTPIGLALTLGGILYLSTAGMKMLERLPVNQKPRVIHEENQLEQQGICCYPDIDGPFEINIPTDYRSHGVPREIAAIRRQYLVNIVAVVSTDGFVDIAPHPGTSIQPGTTICVYGKARSVETFVEKYGLILKDGPELFKKDLFNPAYTGTVEMVISPRSSFIGRTIKDIRFRETYNINALALHQHNRIYYKELADRILHAGDVILVHGTWEQILDLKSHHQNFIIMSPTDVETHKPHKAKFALISFAVALVLMLISSFYFQKMPYNPIPLSLCLMAGAVGMILSGVITISEAYHSIDWRTVFLLAGLIPLGMAVEQTGTAQWLARGLVSGLGTYMSPLLLLVVLAVLSCLFTMVVSNVGACALLVPLGIAIANQIGINPRVAAIVVGIGVSNSFLLPTHQVNALYMGPGEYQTKDYIKIGGGLSLVYIVTLVIVTYLLYL